MKTTKRRGGDKVSKIAALEPRRGVRPKAQPRAEDFNSRQIDLFRALLCNTNDERDALSNAFDLWDSIPRYAVSRQQQERWRKSGTFPLLYKVPFHYRGREITAIIQPANVEGKDGVVRSYYPSASEELIEDVLRKIAADQESGYFDTEWRRGGVVFTLYMVRKELARRGHTRSYQEIIQSLLILAQSSVRLVASDGKDGEGFRLSTFFHDLTAVSKARLAEDPNARWCVDFHPLVSQAMDQLTYRQFNYARLMSHKTQLARWLNKLLCLKYVNAAPLQPFETRLSTIARDSGLLNGYSLMRNRVAALDDAFGELYRCTPPMLSVDPVECREVISGPRGKILDVVYTLWPTREFVAEVKASSKRQAMASCSLPK